MNTTHNSFFCWKRNYNLLVKIQTNKANLAKNNNSTTALSQCVNKNENSQQKTKVPFDVLLWWSEETKPIFLSKCKQWLFNCTILPLLAQCVVLKKWKNGAIKFLTMFKKKFLHYENWRLDDVLWIDFSAAIRNEAFMSSNHKTFFLVLF